MTPLIQNLPKLVKVEVFVSPLELEERLNYLANDPDNQYNLEFLCKNDACYTAVFYLHPRPA